MTPVGNDNVPYMLVELKGNTACPFCKKSHPMAFQIEGLTTNEDDEIEAITTYGRLRLGRIDSSWLQRLLTGGYSLQTFVEQVKAFMVINASVELQTKTYLI